MTQSPGRISPGSRETGPLTDAATATASVYCNANLQEVAVHHLAGGVACAYSAPQPGREDGNQDAAVLIPLAVNSGVLVVADGVGGGRNGAEAAKVVVETVTASLVTSQVTTEGESRAEPPGDEPWLRAAILDGIEAANRVILERGLGAASTLALAEICDGVVRPYHVGDSMVLIVGRRGKLKLQTVSHSPVGFAVEAGLLNEEEAMHHEDRHVVSNVVGTTTMRMEVGAPLALARNDTLLLASDGLFDNLHVGEIVDRIRTGPLEPAVARLIADARARMCQPRPGEPSKPDDLTVIAFRLSQRDTQRQRKTDVAKEF